MRLNLIAPINPLGYGVTGLNVLKALQNLNVDVSLFPIGQPQVFTEDDAHHVVRALDNAKLFDNKSPCIRIWHQNDMAQFVGKGKHIGFPIFELDTFNEIEKHHLSSCDELFVCSEWAKKVIHDQIEKFEINEALGWNDCQVKIVPLGVDTNIFKPSPRTNGDKTVFFNCGKWEVRKGHDILVEAFKQVVTECDNVELWMMCSNPFNTPEEDARWTNLYNHPKIKLIPRAKTHQDVYYIMSKTDCGVFPSRAEGWNLELLEMMAVGRHVITTNYAAHTQFCNNTNSTLIPIQSLAPAYDGKWFFGQGKWANITQNEVDLLAKEMINFHKNKPTDINYAGVETAKFYSWENTAKDIIKYAF